MGHWTVIQIIILVFVWAISATYGAQIKEFKHGNAEQQTGIHHDRKAKQNQITLRNSTFPFVPPYIRFCASERNCKQSDYDGSIKFERPIWKYSRTTRRHVVDVVRNSGFRLLKKTDDWIGNFLMLEKIPTKRVLKANQKMNRLPITILARKDILAKKLKNLFRKHGYQNFGFLPATFVLPEDRQELKIAWSHNLRAELNTPWIIKPTNSCCGNGVELVNDWGRIPQGVSLIVQKYVPNPLLLDGNKFDIRVDVLITGLNPLKIYVYDEYALRRSVTNFTLDPSHHTNTAMHVTNTRIQKQSGVHQITEQWTKAMVWNFIRNLGKDPLEVDEKIHDLIIKTIISAEDYLPSEPYIILNRYNGYMFLGFDVLLDEEMKPWLLEVNDAPSLQFKHSKILVEEMLNIVGYHVGDECLEKFYKNAISGVENLRHKSFEKNFYNSEQNISRIFESLTKDDMTHLITAIDEKSQCNHFQRIFPTSTSQKYF